jgi:hypothetical protein
MRVGQALHGYQDGHRLLAVTDDLTREGRYAVLGMSDMSGRSMVAGFEEYITGYPIPDSDTYAIAKTWYAPEMDRPGCVWTHTLFIESRDLGDIPDLSELLHLFRRPRISKKPSGWFEYETPLSFTPRPSGGGTSLGGIDLLYRRILRSLYDTPQPPVVLLAENSRDFEAIAFAIISQQWTSLRIKFRFCTGSISNRSMDNRPFDLQVVPFETAREVNREIPKAAFIDPRGWAPPDDEPDWLDVVLRDLSGDASASYRHFLGQFARGAFDGRSAFAPLTELYAVLAGGAMCPSLSSLVNSVASRYPKSRGGRLLKRAVLGYRAPLTRAYFADAAEPDLLHALATARTPEAFDIDSLALEKRVEKLWEGDRAGSLQLINSLIRDDHNSIGERILYLLVRSLTLADATALSFEIPGLLPLMVHLNPATAASPELWRGDGDRQRELFDAATSDKGLAYDMQRALVHGILAGGSDAVADRAILKLGPLCVDVVLRWFDDMQGGSPWDISPGWRLALASQPGLLLKWLESASDPREATVALVADLLSPNSRDVISHGGAMWLRPRRQAPGPLQETIRNRFHAFLLTLGFRNPGAGSELLVARSFAVTHRALAGNNLGHDAWIWREGYLPSLSWGRNWDKCERLRRGLAESFIRHDWPADQFLACVADDELLRLILKSAGKVDNGDKLLKRVRRAATGGAISLNRKQTDIINDYT